MSSLVIDGTDLSDFGLVIATGTGTYGAPARDVEVISIPGRNGDLFLDNGRWNNISVSYSAFVINNVSTNINNFRNFVALHMDGYYKISDTYHPDEYRMGRFSSDFAPQIARGFILGSLGIELDCKPQRFLSTGDVSVEFEESGTIVNYSSFSSKPLIEVTGDNGSIQIGSKMITIADGSTYDTITIDCELMDCFGSTNGSVSNANSLVTFPNGFPELVSGSNLIQFLDASSSDITKIKITPRWWAL